MSAPTEDGFYWCSHELFTQPPPGVNLPEQWNVVEVYEGELYTPGCAEAWDAWHGTMPTNVPDYVKFVGPLTPPE